MGTSRSQWVLTAVVTGCVIASVLAVAFLGVSPLQVTSGTVVIGFSLLVGSVALPALLLSRWQTVERTRNHR